MKRQSRYIVLLLCAANAVMVGLWSGCANRGIGPQGGPKDTIPPVITKMTTPQGAHNVQAKDFTIQFNEYVLIDGSTDNIMVSPPQQRPPEIKAVGKKVEIKFQEDLLDSATYTIDFGNQIVDNNEKNPIKDFSYSFATGDRIDSLEIYGQLINAEDLNPMSGILIGLHADTTDSAFLTQPFTRIGRTNEEGEFSIKNVKEGTYRLYALQDQSRDYCFQAGEGLAFQEELITPYIHYRVENDTIYLPDTLDADGQPIADSVMTAEYFYYEPSNLLLRFFKEDYQRHYFQRVLRKEPNAIQLLFGAPQDTLPILEGLPKGLLQANATRDTLVYWLTDSADIRRDTIDFMMTYLKSDSLYNLLPQTDTLQAIYRAPRMSDKAKQALLQKREREGLVLKSNAGRNFNFYDTLRIISPTPVQSFCADSIHLLLKQDTIYKSVECKVEKSDSVGLTLAVLANLKPNQDYRLTVDSAAVEDIYGLSNKSTQYDLHIRSTEEYATMTILLQPYDSTAYIQLLDQKDQPVRTLPAQEKGTCFQYLEPGTYFMRLFIDENGDGKWTTGSYQQHRQPEQVAYFRKKMNLRANWTFEETFRWQELPLLEQKPAAIRKDGADSQKK